MKTLEETPDLAKLIESLSSEINDTKIETIVREEYNDDSGWATIPGKIKVPYEIAVPSEKARRAYEEARKLQGLYKTPELKRLIKEYETLESKAQKAKSELLYGKQGDGCGIIGFFLALVPLLALIEGCEAGYNYLIK
jgi:hypothetical protein